MKYLSSKSVYLRDKIRKNSKKVQFEMLWVPLDSKKADDINDALFTAPFLRGSNP